MVTQQRRPPARRPAPRGGSARDRVLARRRMALIALVVAVPATLALALFTGSVPILILNLVVDVILAGYIAMLLQIKQGQQTPMPRMSMPSREEDEDVRVVRR